MKKLWLTYAWKDNEDLDIDFIVKELDKQDIDLKFDRRNLVPGQRLWSQIGGHITDPDQCDAWGIVLTANSLRSEACVEELSYALDRALKSGEEGFPVFALLHGISPSQLPPALKIRLCIALENNDWTEKVVAAVNRTAPGFIPKEDLSKFIISEHIIKPGDYCLEIRPRFDRISPFMIGVKLEEKESKKIKKCWPGSAGRVPTTVMMQGVSPGKGTLPDGSEWWIWEHDNEINSTSSSYLFYEERPTCLWIGHPKKPEFINLLSDSPASEISSKPS